MGLLGSVVRVGCLRPRASAALEEWSHITRKREDRTRLTDPLAFYSKRAAYWFKSDRVPIARVGWLQYRP
jgi:hypothetical protein